MTSKTNTDSVMDNNLDDQVSTFTTTANKNKKKTVVEIDKPTNSVTIRPSRRQFTTNKYGYDVLEDLIHPDDLNSLKWHYVEGDFCVYLSTRPNGVRTKPNVFAREEMLVSVRFPFSNETGILADQEIEMVNVDSQVFIYRAASIIYELLPTSVSPYEMRTTFKPSNKTSSKKRKRGQEEEEEIENDGEDEQTPVKQQSDC